MVKSLVFPIFILFILISSCNPKSETADFIITNATIWTGDPENPMAQALAVKGDRLVFVGATNEISKYRNSETEILDLPGKFITPGFIDSHVHFISGGFALSSVRLRDADTPEQFINRIGEFAKTIQPGEWITEGNWNHELWGGELPTKDWIDSVTQNNPLFINRSDGHMALANTKALELAGISQDVNDVEGGEIVRNESGELSGIFKDNAMNMIYQAIPNPNYEQRLRAVKAAMKYVAANGVTSVHDMGTFDDQETYERMIKESEKLITRIYSSVPLASWERLETKVKSEGQGNEWVQIGGLKGFVDGSLGSHTAAFFEPFTDAPDYTGLFVTDMSELEKRILNADKAELHVVVHSIGDRANHDLLDIYEKSISQNGPRDRRFRIEHAQHLDPNDIGRFAELGIIPSMQPYHAIDDGSWAEKVIGADRIKTTYAFRDLIDQGANIAFGSDWFVAPPVPLEGIYAATTRRTLDGNNPDGWVPHQIISVEEALKAYTMGGAYASFSEEIKGSLMAGKLADFVIIDKNLMEIPPEKIREAKVLSTYVGGEKVYSSEN